MDTAAAAQGYDGADSLSWRGAQREGKRAGSPRPAESSAGAPLLEPQGASRSHASGGKPNYQASPWPVHARLPPPPHGRLIDVPFCPHPSARGGIGAWLQQLGPQSGPRTAP
jgi:hypothetical protein